MSEEVHLAIAAALNAIEAVVKSKEADTGKYKYRYADLADVIEECKRVCQNHGLTTLQFPSIVDGNFALHLRFIHKSGATLDLEPLVMRLPGDPQAFGSALTYARRYQLVTVFNIPTEDDDGREATTAARTQPGKRSEAERVIREMIGEMPPEIQQQFMRDFKEQFHMGLSDLPVQKHGDALTWAKGWEPKEVLVDSAGK